MNENPEARQVRRCRESRLSKLQPKEKVPISEAERRLTTSGKPPEPHALLNHRVHIPAKNKNKLRDLTRQLQRANSELENGEITRSSFDRTQDRLEQTFNGLVYTWVEPQQTVSPRHNTHCPKSKKD